jgi:hypothetical protein
MSSRSDARTANQQTLDLRGRQGRAQQITLHFVAPDRSQRFHLILTLDSLGDDV